jgi:putative sterol carrier protein
MTDPTAEFFDELGRRGYEPLLGKMTAKLRVDLANGAKTDRWLVAVDKGDVTVAHGNGAADLTIGVDKALFDRLATGEMNATAAVLRGEVSIEGRWDLLVQFQRLFPSPPRAPKRQRATGRRR